VTLRESIEVSPRGAVAGNPPAILLGGSVVALAAARSLGRAGVPVYTLGQASDPTRWSRHCRFVDVGAGRASQERWLEWLERGPHAGVVLPSNDDGLEFVAERRTVLDALGYVPIEADDVVLRGMLDKHVTYAWARNAGIATPRTVTVAQEADLAAAARELGFPCALKSVHSHRFAEHYGMTRKVLLARNEEELRGGFAELSELGISALATEIIPGADDQYCSYYSYLDERGQPLLHLTKRKLRQYPPHFGIGCFHVTDWNPEVAELGLRFFQGVGLRGLACVEFKRDSRDGTLKLIECNHRFTAATELLRAAGMDLPLFTYNRLLGRPTPPVDSYRRGLHLWHPLADARAFLAYRRGGELTLGHWVSTLVGPRRVATASATDPLPAVGTVAHRLAGRARRLGRPQPGGAGV
jgi:D-aspartate ligase